MVELRVGIVAAFVVGAGLACASAATAATNLAQKPGPSGCITETGTSGACQTGRGLVGSSAIALSPEGKNAYVASSTWNSLSVIDRDSADGSLAPIQSQAGCFYSNSPSFTSEYTLCTKVRQLAGATDVAVSPDGGNVYVAAPSDSAVTVFKRNPNSGELTLPSGTDGCVNADGSNNCVMARAMEGATSVTVSPDGRNVYVASSGSSGPNGGIAIFDRDSETGALTQKSGTDGCINETGENGCMTGPNQIFGAVDITLSPDGKTLYAVSSTRQAVTIYSRDTGTGNLTPVLGPGGCVKENGGSGCETGVAMIAPDSITVSPDGRNAYVAGERSHSIAVFDRDSESGELTQKPGTAGCISDTGLSDPMQAGTQGACQDGTAMRGIDSIAILPDGSALYATAQSSAGLDVFTRAPDGTIAQQPDTAGCITENGYENPSWPWTAGTCAQARPLQSANDVIASGDGAHVYTVAQSGSSGVGIFDVVQAPPPPSPPPPLADRSRAQKCGLAKADLKEAHRHIHLEKRAIRRQKYRLVRAGSGRVKRKLRRGVARTQRILGQWRAGAAVAQREVAAFCD